MPEHLAASASLADLEIPSVDPAAIEAATRRQTTLTKPPLSLGVLEELSIRLAGMTDRLDPSLKDAVVFTLAGDHGVAAEGVSAYPLTEAAAHPAARGPGQELAALFSVRHLDLC